MAIASRLITITQGNLDHNHMYITDVADLFPEDVIGGPDESQAAPRTVRVHWGSGTVDTDIVRDKNIFRRRGWVRQFFSEARIVAGDRVLLERIEPYIFRVSKAPT
jgi:DNA polymerase III subunit epsilon